MAKNLRIGFLLGSYFNVTKWLSLSIAGVSPLQKNNNENLKILLRFSIFEMFAKKEGV